MPRMHHSFIQFQYNATKTKAKWQAGVVTKKVIQQLTAEPKVIISANSASRALASHVAKNSTIRDTNVYHSKCTNTTKYGDATISDIESELDKMFCLNNDHSTIKESSKTESTKKSNKASKSRSKVHKQNLSELLIKLFGSDLEDIVEKPPPVEKYQPKKIQSSRRHTLPVSINISHDFLKPLKVSQKRKSANDVIAPDSKTRRIEESVPTICELPHEEFLIAELLIKNETITQRANSTVVFSDLETAIIMERPTTGVSETVQCDLVIDLTGEDTDRYELVTSNSSSQELKEEPSSSSERAMVPEQAPSMPLLSPVSPAQPTQREATLPETSRSGTAGQSSSWQRPPQNTYARIAPKPAVPPQRSPTKRPYQEFQAPPNPLMSVRLPPKRCNGDSVAQAVARNHSVPPSVVAASQLSIRPPTKHANQDSVPQRSQPVPPQVPSGRPQVAAAVPGEERSQQVPPQESSVRQVAERNQQVLPQASAVPVEQRSQQVPPQASSVRQVAERNQQASAIPVEATPISHSVFSNLRMLQADKTSQQAPNLRQSAEKTASTLTIPQSSSLIAMQQSHSKQQPQATNVELLQATVSSILHTAHHQAAVPPPQQMVYGPRLFAQPPQYPGIQRQNSAPSQLQSSQAPPLIRILRPTHSQYEFHLISNAACGEILLPHVLSMMRWKQSAIKFCEEVRTYLAPNDFRQDYASFTVYTDQTLVNFGKKVIRELSIVDVDNFDLREVCAVIARKLQEQNNYTATIYRVFFNIHSMIKSCEELCVTPFTKKFFHNVQMCNAKIEEKSQKSQQVLFTVSQLKQLEWQIQRCLLFQKWLDCMYSPASNRPSQARPLHRSATKKAQKKAEANALKQSLQNTMLRAMLQHQNVPDRSGRTCDNPTRPDVTAVTSDKQTAPSDKSPAVGSQHEVPFRVLLPQQTETAANAVEPSASQETSVIVFTPADENRTEVAPAATKTDENEAEDIIDLTWIDDGDESVMLEEITESKAFPCKLENYPEGEAGAAREVVSPADSGLGSPHSQTDDSYRCLCGKQAIYICACGDSMYCGKKCQTNDWGDHQRWCQEKST